MKYKKQSGYHIKRHYKESLKKSLINEILIISRKDIDNQVSKIPFPSKGDRIFVESDNTIDSYINNSFSNNEIVLPNGYISVSLLLLDLIQYSKSNLVKDSYIFPALFCLRQYLELAMKKSILRFRNNDLKPCEGEREFKTHNLIQLWEKLIKHIDQIDESVICIENFLKELNDIDNDGTAFKYDYKLNNIVSNKNQKKLNNLYDIKILKVRVLQLYSFFEGIDSLSYECTENNN